MNHERDDRTGGTSSRRATETIGTGERRRARGHTVGWRTTSPILLDIQRLRADLAVTSPYESGSRGLTHTRVEEPLACSGDDNTGRNWSFKMRCYVSGGPEAKLTAPRQHVATQGTCEPRHERCVQVSARHA